MTDNPGNALESIRVLDFTRHLAGPFATMTLGDLGADVIKVERPKDGDDTRAFGPFHNGISCYYLSANRNKRGITLDMTEPRGQAIAYDLLKRCDVLVHNFRPGTMERWGLGYEQISPDLPGLVYCEISAVGSSGPDKDRAGVDVLMQAYSGLMSMTGLTDDPPIRVGASVVDLTAGANAVQGILAALLVRARTGRGQKVESSLLEGQVSWLTYHAAAYLQEGVVPTKMGSHHPSLTPYGAYKASDRWFVVAVVSSASWKRFCQALSLEELISDPRFSTNPERCANREILDQILMKSFASSDAAEWVARFDRLGVPASVINTIPEVLALPQVRERGMVVDIRMPGGGAVGLAGSAIRLDQTPATYRMAPPSLGEHTEEVLAEVGISSRRFAELQDAGVV